MDYITYKRYKGSGIGGYFNLRHGTKVTENGGFTDPDSRFYEAASLRKIGDTYYFIYSPKRGSRLAYATSDKPMGPYTYRGYIVDNGVDYPAGNNHGSICRIGDQWYIFYHRMTNGSVMSRRASVEKIEILPDGTIPPVEMTSSMSTIRLPRIIAASSLPRYSR